MNILPPAHKETCKKKSLNNRTLIFVAPNFPAAGRKDQNRAVVHYLTPEVALGHETSKQLPLSSIAAGYRHGADEGNAEKSQLCEHLEYRKSACNSSIFGRAFSNTVCSQKTKVSNNSCLENKATSVLAELERIGE